MYSCISWYGRYAIGRKIRYFETGPSSTRDRAFKHQRSFRHSQSLSSLEKQDEPSNDFVPVVWVDTSFGVCMSRQFS